jgi:predicted RecA/RadA family phage recombinase
MSPAVNEAIPFEEDADRIPCQVGVGLAVTGKRLVAVTAGRLSGPAIPATAQIGASDPVDGGRIQVGPPAAGGHVLGLAEWDAAAGEGVTVVTEGIYPVNSGAAIAAGQAVQTDATGSVIPLAAGVKVGLCVDTVAGAGVDAQIKLLV